MGENATQLSDEQMQQLASLVTDSLAAKINLPNGGGQQPSGNGSGQQPSGDGGGQQPSGGNQEPPGNQQPSGNELTVENIAAAVTKQIQNNSAEENNKVFNTLWADKLNQTVKAVPGFDDFIKGEDDYGNIREDKLNEITDYDKRIAALTKLQNSFSEASAGQSGRRPVVNAKAEKKAKETQAEYDDLNKKLENGEFTSTNQMLDMFSNAVAKEVAGLQGT